MLCEHFARVENAVPPSFPCVSHALPREQIREEAR